MNDPRRAGIAGLVSIAFCLALAVGCAPAPPPDNTAEARAGIEAVNATFMKLVAEKNAAGIAALYTEDAKVLPPNGPPVEGRAAIEQFFAGMRAGDRQGPARHRRGRGPRRHRPRGGGARLLRRQRRQDRRRQGDRDLEEGGRGVEAPSRHVQQQPAAAPAARAGRRFRRRPPRPERAPRKLRPRRPRIARLPHR